MVRLIAVLALLAMVPFASLAQQATDTGNGATLRALDRTTGLVTDISISSGHAVEYERLSIALKECRYPKGNLALDAFAYLEIQDLREDEPRFSGWMIASSPALSALEHPRYDVWLLHCSTT